MKKYFYTLTICVFAVSASFAQETFPPETIIQGTFLYETQPLRDYPTIVPSEGIPENIRIVPNDMRSIGQINPNALILDSDPLNQTVDPSRESRDILQNFQGASISESGFIPPDPSGAAGPNHYVHAVNSLVKIFDKTGSLMAGPTSLGSFLGMGNSNGGDPIVLYDQMADRWIVSQFGNISGGNSLAIGVSTTADPTGTYSVYQFTFPGFPDYPKYGVWPDGYYGTVNLNGATTRAFAMERDVMLAGGPSPQIAIFTLPGIVINPFTVRSPGAANLLGTNVPANAPGYIVYLQDDTWSGSITFDHLKLWEIDMDWVTIGNSTVSAPDLIAIDAFNSQGIAGVPQPSTGTELDALSGIISYMVNYRSFAGHNSFLLNFNVNAGGGQIGIRWVELRNTGNGAFSLFQEGTWTRPDGENRFMGSAAMDINGNIALAYQIGSENTRVGIRHTGRLANDPLGQMSFEEQIIVDDGFFQTGQFRFGDYTQMTMDPDGETFWFTGEYLGAVNNWRTRVAAFNLENIPVLEVNDSYFGNTELIVYPIDSANEEIIVKTNLDLGDVSYSVMDIQGRMIVRGKLNLEGTDYKTTFSTSAMSAGVYMVQVSNENNYESTKKVIIK